MRTVPRERFRAALAALDRERFAGFVVAVSRARGRDAEAVDDRTVRIDGRRVHVHAPGLTGWSSVPEDADAVVTPRAGRPRGVPSDLTVIDGDALYEQAVHGIDAAARERLFDRLDCDPVVDPEPGTGRADRHRSRRRRRGTALAGVLGIALVLAGMFGGIAVDAVDAPAGRDADDLSNRATATPFVPETRASTGAGTAADAPGTTPTPVSPVAYPAWIRPDGRVLGGRLAEAHARAVTGRSYRLILSVFENHRGRTAGAFRQIVTVASPTVYRSTATSIGRPVGAASPRFGIVYSDGARRHVLVNRSNRSYRTTRFAADGGFQSGDARPREGVPARYGDVGPVAAFAAAYIADVFAGAEPQLVGTTVRDGQRLYRIRARDSGQLGNVTTVALVEPSGFVRRLDRRYAPGGSGVEVSITLRYESGVGPITPPEWYRNGTRIGAP